MIRTTVNVVIEQTIEDDKHCDISVRGERNGRCCFVERFYVKDKPVGVHLFSKKKIEESKSYDSATAISLSTLLESIIRSDKTDGREIDDNKANWNFQMLDLHTIRRFEQIANIKFDYSKFSNLREFQKYFIGLLK